MAERQLRLGVVAAALAADVREAARLARLSKVRGLLFDAYAPGMDLTGLSGTGRREFRHLLSSNDVELAGLSADVGLHGLSPRADIDRIVARLDGAMRAAADLSAPLLCVDLGPLPAAPREAKPKPKIAPEEAGLIIIPTFAAAPAPEVVSAPPPAAVDPNFVASVDAAMMELGRRADRYSCVVAFRSGLAGYAALARAVNAARCPWFGVELDPVAVLRDEWSAEEVFGAVAPLVRHVRVHDALKGSGQRTQPAVVGKGHVDWGQTLALLDEAGYHGWMTVDPTEIADRGAAVRQALAHVTKLRS